MMGEIVKHASPGRLAPALIALYMAGLFAWIHSLPGGLTDRDGYFHARYAQLMPERGLSRSFPWTQASTWRDRFADKEFLYHVLLAPFARGEEPVRGAAVFAVLLGSGVFAAFYYFLALHRVRGAAAFTALLACMGGPFLLRLSFIRSHTFSILLFIAGLHLLLERRRWAVFALGFVFSWSYSFPFVLPILAAPIAAGRLWAGEDPDFGSLGALLGGMFLGLIIHPYSPNTLETLLTYADVLRIAASQRSLAAVEVGREFAPYSTRAFLQAYPMLTAVMTLLGLCGWRTGRKLSGDSFGLLCASAAAGLGTMVYARMIEYAAPLTAAAAAFVARDFLDDETLGRLRQWSSRRGAAAWTIFAGASLMLAGVHVTSLSYLAAVAVNDPPRFKKAAQWMKENLDPGETVVNLWWDDFPDLFYHGHRQRYLVGLDPTYMLRLDKDKALLLERTRMGRIPIDAAGLAQTFAARYMILRTPNAGFYPQLALGGWRPVYHDRDAAIFALTGPDGPPSSSVGFPQIPELRGD